MKIVLTLILTLILSCPVYAEIQKQADGKNEKPSIASVFEFDVNPWDKVKFINTTQKDNESCSAIMLFSSEPGLWFFLEKEMDIKIDGIEYKAKFIVGKDNIDKKLHKETRMASYLIEPIMQEKLISAKEVVVKVYCKNRSDIEWTVPAFVLEEWKQVVVSR